jgi:hypothetical protein
MMEDGGEVSGWTSKYHRYELEVLSVDREKLADAYKILYQMNFDNRFYFRDLVTVAQHHFAARSKHGA